MMKSSPWPLLSSLLCAVLLAAIISHAFMRMPFPYADNFYDIAVVYSTPLGKKFMDYFVNSTAFFRPFEFVCRYAIAYGFEQGVFGYNLFLCSLLTLVVITFVYICYPQNGRDVVAFLVALAVLTGHQATQGSFEFATAINSGVILAAATVSIGLIGGSASLWKQLLIVCLTVLSLLTKELGLVIAGTFVLAYLLGMPSMRRWTAAAVVVIVLAYLIFRYVTIADLTALSELKPYKASTFPQYLSNITASFVMFWIGLPTDGDWLQWDQFTGQFWQWVQIAAGLATALLLMTAWRLAPTSEERASCDAPAFDRRWFILFGAALSASCALGFFYARHRRLRGSRAAVGLLLLSVYAGAALAT